MGAYTVYMHISPSGKRYVGLTSQRLADRWGKDGRGYLQKKSNGEYRQPAMAHAVKRYPCWDAWEHRVLKTGLTKEEADQLERSLIEALDLTNPQKGYNIKEGGGNGRPSEETRRKQSEAHKGKKMPEAQKKKIGETLRGRVPSEETRQKISKAQIGRKMSEDRKRVLSEAHMKRPVICIETRIVYRGVKDAEAQTGVSRVCISSVCKGKQKTAGGFTWAFVDPGGVCCVT